MEDGIRSDIKVAQERIHIVLVCKHNIIVVEVIECHGKVLRFILCIKDFQELFKESFDTAMVLDFVPELAVMMLVGVNLVVRVQPLFISLVLSAQRPL